MIARQSDVLLYVLGLLVLGLLTEYQPKLAGLFLVLIVFALLTLIKEV